MIGLSGLVRQVRLFLNVLLPSILPKTSVEDSIVQFHSFDYDRPFSVTLGAYVHAQNTQQCAEAAR